MPDVTMADDSLLWCFDYFYFKDKAMSASVCSPVSFRPITFRLYHGIMETWNETEEPTPAMLEVRRHVEMLRAAEEHLEDHVHDGTEDHTHEEEETQ